MIPGSWGMEGLVHSFGKNCLHCQGASWESGHHEQRGREKEVRMVTSGLLRPGAGAARFCRPCSLISLSWPPCAPPGLVFPGRSRNQLCHPSVTTLGVFSWSGTWAAFSGGGKDWNGSWAAAGGPAWFFWAPFSVFSGQALGPGVWPPLHQVHGLLSLPSDPSHWPEAPAPSRGSLWAARLSADRELHPSLGLRANPWVSP